MSISTVMKYVTREIEQRSQKALCGTTYQALHVQAKGHLVDLFRCVDILKMMSGSVCHFAKTA